MNHGQIRRGVGVAAAILLAACGDGGGGGPIEALQGDSCAQQAPGTACTWLGLKGQEGFNGDGQPRYRTQVNQVQDLMFLPDGSAWFTDFNNYLLRKVQPDGTVISVVGWTDPVFPGDGPPGGPRPEGGAGSEWQLNHPTNLLPAPDGAVLLVAWHNHKLLRDGPGEGGVRRGRRLRRRRRPGQRGAVQAAQRRHDGRRRQPLHRRPAKRTRPPHRHRRYHRHHRW
jgi:hypothetical protein